MRFHREPPRRSIVLLLFVAALGAPALLLRSASARVLTVPRLSIPTASPGAARAASPVSTRSQIRVVPVAAFAAQLAAAGGVLATPLQTASRAMSGVRARLRGRFVEFAASLGEAIDARIQVNEPKLRPALVVDPAVLSVWNEVMAEVEAAAGKVPVKGGRIQRIIRLGLDELLDEATELASTVTREEANQLERRLDHFVGAASLSFEQTERLNNLRTALHNFDMGRYERGGLVSEVVIDPVTVRDGPYMRMSLGEGSGALRLSASEAFMAAMDARLDRLEPEQELELLRHVAGQVLSVPGELYEKLWRNDEWSNFAGNYRSYAIMRLWSIATDQSIAAIALETKTDLLITGKHREYGRLSWMAEGLLMNCDTRQALRAVALARLELAQSSTPYGQYYDRYPEFARELDEKLQQIGKTLESRL